MFCTKPTVRKPQLLTGGLALLLSGLMSGSVMAASVLPQFEQAAEDRDFRLLDDQDLAGIRGRFASGNQVLLFGMEMSTVWQSPSGEHFQARADLQVDLTGSSPVAKFTPHITAVSSDAYQQLTTSTGGNAAIVDLGTGNARGVVQVVQAGGNYNAAGNDFQLNINSGYFPGNASGNGLQELSTESGAVLSIHGNSGGLGMRISVPGQGEVRQGVISGKGLHQAIRLEGSHQNVHNLTRMQVQLNQQQDSSISTGGLRRAVESAQGLDRIR